MVYQDWKLSQFYCRLLSYYSLKHLIFQPCYKEFFIWNFWWLFHILSVMCSTCSLCLQVSSQIYFSVLSNLWKKHQYPAFYKCNCFFSFHQKRYYVPWTILCLLKYCMNKTSNISRYHFFFFTDIFSVLLMGFTLKTHCKTHFCACFMMDFIFMSSIFCRLHTAITMCILWTQFCKVLSTVLFHRK